MSSTGMWTANRNLRQTASDTVLLPAPGAPVISQIAGRSTVYASFAVIPASAAICSRSLPYG